MRPGHRLGEGRHAVGHLADEPNEVPHVFLDRHVNVIVVDTGQLHLDREVVLAFPNAGWGVPGRRCRRRRTEEIVEQVVQRA